METIKPRGEPQRNGHNVPSPDTATAEEPWSEEALRQEVQRLAGENQHLLGMMAGAADDELTRLRSENAQLKANLEELEQLLSSGGTSADWAEQQKEYEALLEEKSEVIRSLHQKLQEERAGAEAGLKDIPANADLPASERQLLALKAELEEQKAQLEADEESLMTQMRQMEMMMARERAEMARQRTEMQRLHNDLKHEMEQAARDGSLRERLNNLQRRQPEATPKNPAATPPSEPTPAPTPAKNTGVLRRLFRPGT